MIFTRFCETSSETSSDNCRVPIYLEEGNINQRRVKVDELEEKNFKRKTGFVFRLRSRILYVDHPPRQSMIYSREYHYYHQVNEGSSHGSEYFRVSFQESTAATVKDGDQRDAVHDRSQNCTKNHADLRIQQQQEQQQQLLRLLSSSGRKRGKMRET